MSDTEVRLPSDATARSRRKQQKRRVKRGIVASYIHEISQRHHDAVTRDREPELSLSEAREAVA